METTAMPEYERGLTFEKVWAMFQETDRKFQETDRKFKETDRKFKETDRKFQETDRKFQETERLIKENAERQKETDEQMKETSRKIGFLDNRFGELAQHLVAPNIMDKFNTLGLNLTRSSLNVKIKEPKNPDVIAEVDILLENGDIAVAVEIKATPDNKCVEKHLERMEKLRHYALRHDNKRKYYGAIAGAILSEKIRQLILQQGFYLIEQTGDTVKITLPEGFKPREW